MSSPDQTATHLIPRKGKPGPATELAKAGVLPGETGHEALTRIGSQFLPAERPDKRTTGGKPRAIPRQLAAVMAMRTEGMSNKEIAKALGLTCNHINRILYKARKDHGLKDLPSRINDRLVHSAIDNLIEGVEEGDWIKTKYALDKTIFKKAEKSDDASKVAANILHVKIEMPQLDAGQQLPVVAVGSIAGTPQGKEEVVVEGEVASAV